MQTTSVVELKGEYTHAPEYCAQLVVVLHPEIGAVEDGAQHCPVRNTPPTPMVKGEVLFVFEPFGKFWQLVVF